MSVDDRKKHKHISIERFLKQKRVIEILGENYILTDKQQHRLQLVLNGFSEYDIISCQHEKNIALMIKYDLTNYYGRLRRLRELKNAGCYSTSLYGYVLRYGKKYAYDIYLQKKEKHVKNLPCNVDFWLKKGYTEEEARQKISSICRENGKKAADKMRGNSEYSCRSIKFWLKKGYTEEEARREVKRVQGVGSKEQFIKRYGETEGIKKWEERQQKWLNTLNSKTDEEKEIINKKKTHTIESYTLTGYTEEEAIQKSINYYKKRNNYSIISQKFFDMLDEKLDTNTYYKLKNYERQINNINVDFYDKDRKIVIEFNGDFWHGRKQKYDDEFIIYGKTAKERREYDENRYKRILKSDDVYNILVVWESDFRKNPNIIVQKTLDKMEKIYVSRNGNICKGIEEIIC